MDAAVELQVTGAIATVTLNRPDRMNAMNDELLDQLADALGRVGDDDEIGAVILTGAGRAFCVGGDLQGFSEDGGETPRSEAVSRLRRQSRAAELLRTMPAVTIAAVNGACAGAGLGLAAAADLRFAASGAVFRTAFLNAALSGDFGTAWSLSRLLGEARARELFFMDEKITAEQALSYGLVSRVVAGEELLELAERTAERIAAHAPLARRGAKANLNESHQLGLAEALANESPRHVACAYSEDATEAARAFLDRRPPVFSGR